MHSNSRKRAGTGNSDGDTKDTATAPGWVEVYRTGRNTASEMPAHGDDDQDRLLPSPAVSHRRSRTQKPLRGKGSGKPAGLQFAFSTQRCRHKVGVKLVHGKLEDIISYTLELLELLGT